MIKAVVQTIREPRDELILDTVFTLLQPYVIAILMINAYNVGLPVAVAFRPT
jgi:hypothetical protein